MAEDAIGAAVAAAYRAEWTQVLATVIRVTRDFDLAEDCVHDAFTQAMTAWDRSGIPDRPGAWLTTVAIREALQAKRRSETAARNVRALLLEDEVSRDPSIGTAFEALPDDRLRLIFTCCHPGLPNEARVALTLRLVCGLSTDEVASAFLVKPTAMQARITRAKKRIVDAGITYAVPTMRELPGRLASVCDTVQLVFNAGYLASSGARLMRVELADRAVAMARMLHELLPDEPEATALLAWLRLTDARRAARLDATGALVPLDDQDRSRWDRVAIEDGLALLHETLARGGRDRFTVLACIAAVHAEAESAEKTDWIEIVALYGVLRQRWPSPVVALNEAIAIGAAHGPAAGLAALAVLVDQPELTTYAYLPAARADFLRRLDRFDEAAVAYREALALTDNEIEAAYLQRRLIELGR